MSYIVIPESDEELASLEGLPFLVVGSDWLHADVGMYDTVDGVWYSPVDGSEFYPLPTHYMEIPKFN